jgi:hypothetical protein
MTRLIQYECISFIVFHLPTAALSLRNAAGPKKMQFKQLLCQRNQQMQIEDVSFECSNLWVNVFNDPQV